MRLFVVAQAANIAIHRVHTADALDKEILKADVQSFSHDNNPDISYSRRLKHKQDAYGKIRNIPTERLIRKPPNVLMLLIVGFVALGVVAYGQSNPTISAQAEYVLHYYWADLTVLVVLLLALMAWAVMALRGRRKSG